MASPTEDLLDKILKQLEANKEADDARAEAAERSIETAFAKFSLGRELANVIGAPGNLMQPYAFIGQANAVIQERREMLSALNKQSLAFGESIDSLRNVAEIQEGAQNYGPQIALKTAIDAMRNGLAGASKATYELGMQMQAVGESSDLLFNVQRQAQVLGGITLSQMDGLSKSLENARSQYGISTEYLVNAMGSLADRFMDFSLMGITADVSEAMMGLVTKYGAGTAELFNKAINSLTSGGNIAKFARFGVSEDVASFLEKPTAEGLEAIADKAGAFFEQQVSNFRSLNKAEAVAQAKSLFGEEGAMFAAIAKLTPQERQDPKAAEDALKSQVDIQRDIARSIGDDLAGAINSVTNSTIIQAIMISSILISILATLKATSFGAALKSSLFTITGIFGSIAGMLSTAFSAIAVALGPIGLIALVAVGLGALIYGLYKYFEDDKPIQIIPPKAGGQFITNEYMAANAELTKGILGSVFASQQMLAIAQQKQTNALLTNVVAGVNKTAYNTSVVPSNPPMTPLATSP